MTDPTPDPMNDLADALKQSAISTREALDAIVVAATSLADSVTAAGLVRIQRGDLFALVDELKENDAELKRLIMEQGERINTQSGEIRALRAQLDANGHKDGGAQ